MKTEQIKCPICEGKIDVVIDFGASVHKKTEIIHSNENYIHGTFYGFSILKHVEPESELILTENQ